MTKGELQEKRDQLEKLAAKVDTLVTLPLEEDMEKEIGALFFELEGKLNAIDIHFLETKIAYYQKIYDTVKGK
jgi:hypothetical protein